MAESELLLDRGTIEEYVRDARLAFINASAYVVLVSAYAAVRIVFDVPYLRAAVGLYVVVSVLAVLVKRHVVHEVVPWLVASAAAGLVLNVAVVVALVESNHGTIYAELAGALVGLAATHVIDRAALARA
jgi:hypothetical protein